MRYAEDIITKKQVSRLGISEAGGTSFPAMKNNKAWVNIALKDYEDNNYGLRYFRLAPYSNFWVFHS